MSLIVEKCSPNWLNKALAATRDPLKIGRMLTTQEFIECVDFKVDKFSMDKFYINMDNEVPVYVDNSIIKWFGYKGNLKKQKEKIKSILQKNFSEYENKYWFNYSNKEYSTFYSENPTPLHRGLENNEKNTDETTFQPEIYPNPTEFKGKNKTKHMIVHPVIFKHVVLMADTQKSMEIRDYYITLEEVIKKYSKYQFEASQTKNQSLMQLMEDNKIMTHKIYNKLEESEDSRQKSEESTIKFRKKLDTVLPQRVDIEESNPECPQVFILRDLDAEIGEPNLYAMRCQTKSYNSQLRALKSKYGDNIRRTLTIKQPNAVVFWNSVKRALSKNMEHDVGNWFMLKNMTKMQFKRKVIELNKHRLNA
jgi:hypothetical protein